MNFYFHIDGQNVGPLKRDQISEMIGNGKVKMDTLAWKQGMAEWSQVKDLPELVSAFPELGGGSYTFAPPSQEEQKMDSGSSESHQTITEPYADFMPRFLAGLIDVLILLIPSFIVAMFIPVIGGFVVCIPYYLYFMSDYGGGQTIGYKAMKLKLVGEDTGKPIQLAPLFLWYLVLSFAGIIGWIWFFTDNRRRMLHNIASKTVVINVGSL